MSTKITNEQAELNIKTAFEKIQKVHGKGVVMKLSDKPNEELEVVSTGSLGLDIALGVGGLPRGRIVEIYGPESSGKTTLTLHTIAQAQQAGGKCAFIDVEHAFDATYAQNLGINVEELYFSQPDYGEQALEVADILINTGGFAVLVIDSVAALIPKAELDGEMGDSKMGLHARLMSQAMRKMTASVSRTNTLVIFINQLRDKIGIVFGSPETTTGGNALKFYASVRLDIRKSTQIKDGEEAIGNRTKVKVVKNKVAPPFKTAEFDIIFGEGVSRSGEIVDKGVEIGLIQKSGSWYSYESNKLGQGRDAVIQLLVDNPEMADDIQSKILKQLLSNE